jgi:hypothetical protein
VWIRRPGTCFAVPYPHSYLKHIDRSSTKHPPPRRPTQHAIPENGEKDPAACEEGGFPRGEGELSRLQAHPCRFLSVRVRPSVRATGNNVVHERLHFRFVRKTLGGRGKTPYPPAVSTALIQAEWSISATDFLEGGDPCVHTGMRKQLQEGIRCLG